MPSPSGLRVSPWGDHDIPALIRRLGPRIHYVHFHADKHGFLAIPPEDEERLLAAEREFHRSGEW